jgi:hypothetical protein
MKNKLSLLLILSFITPLCFAEAKSTSHTQGMTASEVIQYPSSGSATVIIDRPIAEVFKTLTNVTQWPKINQGVTQAITPKIVDVKKGAKFKETIASPIPGIANWTKELTVEEYIPNRRFVISGVDTFAPNAPIFARLTYEFKEKTANSTIYTRTTEVDLSDHQFIEHANKQEIESLYRFLGSQWEMANHLKHYVENATH